MKNLMSKIKGMNYKEFAVEHGEKIVLCLIALFVTFAILTTKWTTEKRTPAELTQKADASESQVKNSRWPEDKRNEFLKVDNLNAKAKELMAGVGVQKYEFSTPISWRIYSKKERAKEVEFLPIEDLIAHYGRVIMQKRPPGMGLEGEMGGPDSETGEPGDTKSNKDDENTEFKRRTGIAGAGMGGPGGAAIAGMTFGSMPAEMAMAGGPTNPAMDAEFIPPGGAFPGAEMAGMPGMEMQGPVREGRGLRFIAVRGVFDLEAQQDKLERALGESFSMQNMQSGNVFDFLDFELERKTIVHGQDPATGKWEKVDISTTIDILNESADFDPEIVNTNITNNVMTVPLPSRIAGFWGKKVTHPRVENFTLTPEQIEQEVELNQHFLDQYKKTHASEKIFKEKQKGFSRLQLNMRGIRNDIMTMGMPEEADAVFGGMAQSIQAIDPNEPLDKKKLIQRLKDTANAAGRLLLFRYLDFDLNPGETYAYRVRLVVRNPNFGRPIEAVELPSVAEGETRTTPWSNETAAVTVKQDVQYFLSSVRPPRGSSGTTASFEVYQWYPKTGTTIHSVLKTSVGEEIGGEHTTELYDVAKEKYDNKATVEFDTQNYLVDAIPVPTIRPDEHPDLNLSKKTRGVLPIDAEAIIVDNFGNLKKSLPPAASANYETTKRNFDRERKALEWVKTATEARTAGPADGFGPAGEPGFVGMVPGAFGPEAEMLGPPKKGKKNRRKKNPIRVPIGP